MADFNPNVPKTNDPNWLGWSKSITQPQPDTSIGELLNTVGTVGGEAVKFADYAVKTAVQDETYDKTRKLQDDYTSSLEKADISTQITAAAGGRPGTPTDTGTGGPKSVYDAPPVDLSANARKTPRELENLPDTLAVLDGARGNGKIGETPFYGRLVALAKDLRSKYPGYRDYIDQEIEKVSGVNPANKYITSLVGDINSFANANKEENNKIHNAILEATKFGVKGGDIVRAAYDRGDLGTPPEAWPKILRWLGPAHANKLDLEIKEQELKLKSAQDKDTERHGEDMANTYLKDASTNFFNLLHLTQGGGTAQQTYDTIKKLNAGEISDKDVDPIALGRSIATQRSVAEMDFENYLDKTTGKDGRTLRSILPPEKQIAIKNSNLSRFDTVQQLIQHKEWGIAFSAMNSNRVLGDRMENKFLTDREMGPIFLASQVFNKLGMEKFSKEFFQSQLETFTAPQFGQFLKRSGILMSTQTDEAGNPSSTPVTLNEQIQDFKKRTNGANSASTAMTYDGLIRAIETIADPKNTDIETKRRLATAAFDSKNLGVLTSFGEDAPNRPGKYAIFQRLYADDMTKSIKELGPDSWKKYKEMGEQAYGRELFGPFLKNIANINARDSGISIGWDTELHHWKFKEGFAGPGAIPATGAERAYLKSQINQVNFATDRLANIAKTGGTDVDAYLLGVMKEYGADISKVDGLPAKMYDEMIRAKEAERLGAEKFREKYNLPAPRGGTIPRSSIPKPTPFSNSGPPMRNDRLPYSEEDAPSSGNIAPNAQRGSLSDFILNPMGNQPKYKTPQNAPQSRSNTRKSINLSDQGPIMGIQTTDVPEGANLNDYLRK